MVVLVTFPEGRSVVHPSSFSPLRSPMSYSCSPRSWRPRFLTKIEACTIKYYQAKSNVEKEKGHQNTVMNSYFSGGTCELSWRASTPELSMLRTFAHSAWFLSLLDLSGCASMRYNGVFGSWGLTDDATSFACEKISVSRLQSCDLFVDVRLVESKLNSGTEWTWLGAVWFFLSTSSTLHLGMASPSFLPL